MSRRKTGDKKLTEKKNRSASGKVSHVQADHYSIAFEQVQVGGNVGGDIRIGHTIGYTVEQVSVLLKQITTTLQPKPFDGRCPYKGLEVFEEEDAELFFGRERLVNELVGRVKESRTVFITGPSGSGKSSLVRAGLIHALKQGRIKSSDRWLYETMKPGREPLKDLALAFSRLKSPDLQDYFLAHRSETDILNKCAESVLGGRKDQRFVLFVDQFEEVFTQINSEEERVAFINMLAQAGTVENGRVIVLFAMRSDFVSNCATYPALNELLSQEFRQIGAMQPDELVSAIALPALHVGLPVENELIAQIINDMKGEPDALPLMQFALKDLFDAKQAEGGVIALTLKDYLGHGGIHKSLERHADATFAKLSESEQELTRSIFSGLIEIGRGTQDTKRTALFDELIPANVKAEDVLVIVQKLADARLIITDEQAGKDTVTISHEKLIEAWPWLKRLVNENRDVIALQNEIASDAKEWEDHQRDPSYLYTGARLANAQEKLDAKKLILSGLAKEFIEMGIEVYTNELEEVKKRAEHLQRLSNIALSRQLVAQAHYINATRGYKQQVLSVLLATQSMKIFPTYEAAQILLHQNFATHRIRVSHDDAVLSVNFSPDGRYMLSSAHGNTFVSETSSGKKVAHIEVGGLLISPDGNYLISGTYGWVYETSTGRRVSRLRYWDSVPFRPVSVVAYSPDGKYLVLIEAHTDKAESGWSLRHSWSVRVSEISTGKDVASMRHDADVRSVVFSPNGKYVASGRADNVIYILEISTDTQVAHMRHDAEIRSIAFSPDGKYVLSASENSGGSNREYDFRVWEAATGKEIAHSSTHYSGVTSVAFGSDGRHVAFGGADNTARVWEVYAGKEVARMVHDGITSVAFSPDGKYVASGGGDNTARVWEVYTGKEVARMVHDGPISSIAFSRDGRHVASGSQDKTACVWEASSSVKVIPGTSSSAFSRDGKYMASKGADNTARVWELSSGKEVARRVHDTEVLTVVFSPDGKYVLSASGYFEGRDREYTACVWEIATGKEIARFTDYGRVTAVAFSSDGKYVVSGSDAGHIGIWEATTGKDVALMTQDGFVTSVACSPDGRYAVSGSDAKKAYVWEATTGKEVARMDHDDLVTSVACSPDGRYAVSGGKDHRVKVWEATTGKEVARMVHDGSVTSVACSPDGRYVVSGSQDKTACVWEATTGKEVARLAHDGSVTSVAFISDGKYVVSVSDDSTTRAWVWQPEDLIENACSHLPRNLTRTEWNQYIGDTLPYQAVCPSLPIEPEPTPTAAP